MKPKAEQHRYKIQGIIWITKRVVSVIKLKSKYI